MMGNNLVSWESQPLERSPADPEQVELEKRIVYNPPVTHPTANTIWYAGRKETVTWTVDQDQIPANAKNYEAVIKLGYVPKSGAGGYNLKWTLAKVPITDEEADITLPADLEPRRDYIIVVMGDSGNRSKKFQIRKAQSDLVQANKCISSSAKETKTKSSNSHPVVRERSVDEEKDTFAAHMLGRDVDRAAMQ
jgi:hypothetical protein